MKAGRNGVLQPVDNKGHFGRKLMNKPKAVFGKTKMILFRFSCSTEILNIMHFGIEKK